MTDDRPRDPTDDLVNAYGLERCTDCLACTTACPFGESMDVSPASMVRRTIESGVEEIVGLRAIWLCTDCRACSRACPVGIDVGAFVEALRREAFTRGAAADEPVRTLHVLRAAEALDEGRVREARIFLKTRRSGFPRAALAMALALKGKLGRLFGRCRPVRE